jgi:hypothetical protein
MIKTLINSKREYLEHSFPICDREHNNHINEAFGINIVMECYDHDANNNMIDELGNIIPPSTIDNVKVDEWVDNLTYPLMLLEWIEFSQDRLGKSGVICVETVCLKEFDK